MQVALVFQLRQQALTKVAARNTRRVHVPDDSDSISQILETENIRLLNFGRCGNWRRFTGNW
jgi:hypothetical protein